MPLPAGFPTFNQPPPQRRPPPDYTHRGTKLRLFAAAAAAMLVLFLVERGRDPRLWQLLRSPPVAPDRIEPQPVQAERQLSQPAAMPAAPDLAGILERFGIGPAELARFVDGQTLTQVEEELLAKILYRFPWLGLDNLQRWRQEGIDWTQLASAPDDHRAEVFQVRGRARRVEKVSLPAEQAELVEFGHYYRVTLNLNDSNQTAILFARHVPAVWPLDQPLDEPAETDALFLKAGEPQADSPSLMFAADRVAWLPDKLDRNRGIEPTAVALAKLGMDIGLWEDVRELNHRPLETSDHEAFYQLLAAVGQPQATALLATSEDRLAIGPLLEQPQRFQGHALQVAGTARRIRRIDVPDADVRTRFGIDHYYEIDLFVPLGDSRVRLGDGKDDDQQPEFRNTFPATLIVRQLPPGLTAKENLHEQIRAGAVFFKIWTYKSRYADRFGQEQPAPLFVAFQPHRVAGGVESNWVSSLLVSAALGVSLAILMLVLWWSARPGMRRRSTTAATPPPDFSRLR